MSSPETRSTDTDTDPQTDADQADAEVSIEIAAGIDRVWEALVTDGGLEPWMGRGATIDPRPDGTLQVPDVVGGQARRGLVHTVDTENRLGFTWWPEHRPVERSNVSITLTPTETGTRVTVIEAPLPTTVGTRVTMSAATGAHVASARLTSSLRGCWSWRLAVLSLASQMVRV